MKLAENIMEFDLHGKDGSVKKRSVEVKTLCLARATSRDIEKTRKEFEKKRAAGFAVYTPPNVCLKGRYLLTNEDVIEVQEPRTTGEVEYVAVMDGGETFISVGSDHNDATLIGMASEAVGKVYDTAKCKQLCPAVVARDLWSYGDVKDHWDALRLRSSVTISGKRVQYQNFPLSSLVDLEYHFRVYPWLKQNGTVLFSGSSAQLPSAPPNLYNYAAGKEGIFPSDFHFEMHDPSLGRTISHGYGIQVLDWPDSDICR